MGIRFRIRYADPDSNANRAGYERSPTPVRVRRTHYAQKLRRPEVQALRDKAEELADDVRNLSTLSHSLRSALVAEGLIKGSA
jgi:hypothetical protein